MATLTSPSYATTETQAFQAWHKQKQRRVRKSHNPSFIVSYPYVTNYMPNPFGPEGWYGATEEGDILENQLIDNPSGTEFIGYAEQVGADQFIIAANDAPTDNTFSVLIGDKVYQSMILKAFDGEPPFVRFRFADSQGFLGNTYYDTLNSVINTGIGSVTSLGDDYYLVQAVHNVSRDDSNFSCQIFMWADFVNTATPSGAAPIGSKLYVQAAFSGKADDYPANVMPTL